MKDFRGSVIRYFNADIHASWNEGIGTLVEDFVFDNGWARHGTAVHVDWDFNCGTGFQEEQGEVQLHKIIISASILAIWTDMLGARSVGRQARWKSIVAPLLRLRAAREA